MSSAVESISVDLPPRMLAEVRAVVETGEYASSNEVIRDALREWAQNRKVQAPDLDELRRLWSEARDSRKPGIPADQVLERLEQKYQSMSVEQARSGKQA
ncbi:ribbon-helix-helix domain-containing protein [Terriglobus sp.]|uniref:ribbon-helix-helix domain-containing protein n=1 Tax=Terriglobus sp. TaxID=1889013 RepID=UPI003B00E6F3